MIFYYYKGDISLSLSKTAALTEISLKNFHDLKFYLFFIDRTNFLFHIKKMFALYYNNKKRLKLKYYSIESMLLFLCVSFFLNFFLKGHNLI